MAIRHEKNIFVPKPEVTNEELMKELQASREENAKIMDMLQQVLEGQKPTRAKRS